MVSNPPHNLGWKAPSERKSVGMKSVQKVAFALALGLLAGSGFANTEDDNGFGDGFIRGTGSQTPTHSEGPVRKFDRFRAGLPENYSLLELLSSLDEVETQAAQGGMISSEAEEALESHWQIWNQAYKDQLEMTGAATADGQPDFDALFAETFEATSNPQDFEQVAQKVRALYLGISRLHFFSNLAAHGNGFAVTKGTPGSLDPDQLAHCQERSEALRTEVASLAQDLRETLN